MRKTEREIKDRKEIDLILRQGQVCRVGFCDGNIPYIVPMNYGYRENCLYFHCATEGKKLDLLQRNNDVCFEIETDVQIVRSTESVCKWGTKYRSVIGTGKAFIVDEWEKKAIAMNLIIQHYGAEPRTFSEPEVENLIVIEIYIAEMTGKKAGY
jgi:uncharacterized protein